LRSATRAKKILDGTKLNGREIFAQMVNLSFFLLSQTSSKGD